MYESGPTTTSTPDSSKRSFSREAMQPEMHKIYSAIHPMRILCAFCTSYLNDGIVQVDSKSVI